jgi:hypothetical protein
MKMFKMLLAGVMGMMLQGALMSSAVADDMKGNMPDTKMQDSKMQDTKMQEKKMQDDKMMDDKMAAPMAPMTAMLVGAAGHHAAGKVTFAKEMGKDVLVLSDLEVDKVPDGHVFLAKNGDRTQGIDLGVLKQFSGTVSFALPAGTTPEAYDSVIIYCEKFKVEIGRAQLGKKKM